MITGRSDGRMRGWSVAQCGPGGEGGIQAELKLTTRHSAPVGIRRFKNVGSFYEVINEAGFLI
jgi:hypothetical protein